MKTKQKIVKSKTLNEQMRSLELNSQLERWRKRHKQAGPTKHKQYVESKVREINA